MPGTILVLVIVLPLTLLFFVALMLTASVLARRNGQKVRKVSWSPAHGYNIEFCCESHNESTFERNQT
jgi:hypothetical protein